MPAVYQFIQKYARFLLMGIATLAIVLVVFSTRLGPGVGGDATIYITCAKNLLAGKGLGLIGVQGEFRLIPYFPPFFPLVLSLFGLASPNLVVDAHVLNTLLLGALVYLAGYFTLNTSRSALLALSIAALLAFSPVLLPVYSWAMSEPLNLFLGFAGLVMATRYLRSRQRSDFILSALLAGLAFLTRYSGFAFLAAGAALLLFFEQGAWFKRFKFAFEYGILGSLPMLVWLAIDYSLTTGVASRSVESSSSMFARLVNFWPQLSKVILLWLVPDSWISTPPYPAYLNTLLLLAFAAIILASALCLFWRLRRVVTPAVFQLAAVLALFILAYLSLILLVYITTYPPITIDARMLSPVHVAVIWLLAICAYAWLLDVRIRAANYARAALVFLLLIVLGGGAYYAYRTQRIVKMNNQLGLGYNSRAWQESDTIRALKALPPEQVVVTNETMAVLYLTGRIAHPLAEIYANQPDPQMPAYGQGSLDKDPGQKAFTQGAPLVLFDSIAGQFEGLYAEQTSQRMSALLTGLRKAYRGADGGIYYYK